MAMKRAKMVKRFPLPAGCDLDWIEIRETDGSDERIASVQVGAKGPGESTMTLELIGMAIVAYQEAGADNEVRIVDWPTEVFDEWSTRTRGFVRDFFENINGRTPGEQVTALLAGKIVAGAAPAASTSSGDGSSKAAP